MVENIDAYCSENNLICIEGQPRLNGTRHRMYKLRIPNLELDKWYDLEELCMIFNCNSLTLQSAIDSHNLKLNKGRPRINGKQTTKYSVT
jgi:hypothetical protein